ncbi:hypothetical protein BMJ22_14210 [Sinorhizobium medicae]|nr:hypothetical protein BMJ22_14210 [Sinorhizobium medicae]
MTELKGSEFLDFIKNPDGWQEPEVIARIREHEEFFRKHGYCESDIEALLQLKADLCIDQYPGWSSQPTKA